MGFSFLYVWYLHLAMVCPYIRSTLNQSYCINKF